MPVFLLVFLYLFVHADSTDFNFKESVHEQILYYAHNIQSGKDIDLNLWALNEVYSSNCSFDSEAWKDIAGLGEPLLTTLYNDASCSTDASINSSLKRLRFKLFSLETGSFQSAVNYLALEDKPEERSEFKQLFDNKWKNNLSNTENTFLNNITVRQKQLLSATPTREEVLSLLYLLAKTNINNYFYFNENDTERILNYLSALRKRQDSELFHAIIEFNIFKINYDTNNYKAITEYHKGFLNAGLFPLSHLKLRTLTGIDFSLYVSGRFDESLNLQRNYSLPLAEYYNERRVYDDILVRQSSNLYRIGKYGEAKDLLESLRIDSDFTGNQNRLLTNLSLCYLKLGEYKKYVSLLLQALPGNANQNLSDAEYTIALGSYRNLFILYTALGDTVNAMNYIDYATRLAEKRNDSIGHAGIHADLGTFYWYLNYDTKRALAEYNLAANIYEQNSDYYNLNRVLLNKSFIYTDRNQLAEAAALLDKVRENAVLNSDTPQFVTTLIGSLDIALRKEDVESAAKLIKQIKIYPLNNLSFETLTKYHSLRALYLSDIGQKREAYSYLEPFIEQVIERIKATTDVQTGHWFARHDYLNAFEIMISILQDLDDEKKAIAYLDRFKTINSAAMYNNPLLRAAKLSEEELIEDNILNNRILELRSKYLSSTSDERLTIKAEIDRLTTRQQQYSSKVKMVSDLENIAVWRIQNQLNYNELVLHFTELKNKLYVSTISKSDIDIKAITLTPEVRRLFEDSANKLAGSETSLNHLFSIYKLLNLGEIPGNINLIAVIPDNYLYRIPLEVLPLRQPNSDSSYGSSRYMIEDFTFEYFNSLTDFVFNKRLALNRAEHSFSAFSITNFSNTDLPPLPYASREAAQIAQSLTSFEKSKKTIYSGNTATKQNFLKEISESGVVHLATHSEISEQDPLFSTIYLKNNNESANGDSDDDILYAYELFNTKLNSNFIMLNSCSSGSGGYLQGSGILGISRALKYAGAKSLGLNLWSINDHIAANIAADFYAYLNEGYSKSDAIRMAKINQIQNGNANPHYWGAYSIIGNPSPIIRKPATAFIIYPSLALISILISFLLRRRIL